MNATPLLWLLGLAELAVVALRGFFGRRADEHFGSTALSVMAGTRIKMAWKLVVAAPHYRGQAVTAGPAEARAYQLWARHTCWPTWLRSVGGIVPECARYPPQSSVA